MVINQRTIVNKSWFRHAVELKEVDKVGRSLVARCNLQQGNAVLREKPLIQFLLIPHCRSSLSPYHSKRLWNEIVDIVLDEEKNAPYKAMDAKRVLPFYF